MDGTAAIPLLVLGLYFLPAVVAFSRDVPDKGTVAVLNTFLGWTFMGWVVSMARACGSR